MLYYVITAIVALFAGLAIGVAVGIRYRKKVAEAAIGSAELQAKKIIADGMNQAKSDAAAAKKEALIEAKEEMLRAKNEFEQEIKERRSELSRQERRVQSKEENLDRKTDALEKKEEALAKKVQENEQLSEDLQNQKTEARMALQRISGMTAEQARDKLIEDMVEEVKHEQAKKMVELEQEFKDEADDKARNIVALAIQRCAADHVAEITVSTVTLPSEEMKGRTWCNETGRVHPPRFSCCQNCLRFLLAFYPLIIPPKIDGGAAKTTPLCCVIMTCYSVSSFRYSCNTFRFRSY